MITSVWLNCVLLRGVGGGVGGLSREMYTVYLYLPGRSTGITEYMTTSYLLLFHPCCLSASLPLCLCFPVHSCYLRLAFPLPDQLSAIRDKDADLRSVKEKISLSLSFTLSFHSFSSVHISSHSPNTSSSKVRDLSLWPSSRLYICVCVCVCDVGYKWRVHGMCKRAYSGQNLPKYTELQQLVKTLTSVLWQL